MIFEHMAQNDHFQARLDGKSLEDYIEYLKNLTLTEIDEIKKQSEIFYPRFTPLRVLLDYLGFDTYAQALDGLIEESIVPAICEKCRYICESEPESNGTKCPNCGENGIKSLLILGKEHNDLES
jgi:hypothetical protein